MTLVLDYIELAVGDLALAKDFYSKAMGWTFTDYGPEYAGLQDPRTPGQEFGGLSCDGAAGGAGGVLALASTDDAEAAVEAVIGAGGRIVVELHAYPGGRRFTFADPWGNVLGIYERAH